MSGRSRKHRAMKYRTQQLVVPSIPLEAIPPEPGPAPPAITVMAFSPGAFIEEEIADLGSLRRILAEWTVTWVNVDGVGNGSTVLKIGEFFGFHPLALEDTINVHQRAKVEQYSKYDFIVARMVTPSQGIIETEQLSLFLGENFVVTFQELPGGDCLDPVRERIRKGGTKIRSAGPDYLAYSLLDAAVDSYFPVLEDYGEQLETLEDKIIISPDNDTVRQIHEVKRELLLLRRAVWPFREALNSLIRDEMPFITNETRIYLRDCYDHAVRIIDLVETYRELGSDLMDCYLSSISNKLNEVMKVLTIITLVFIPPTFIAGVYGMNFNPTRSPFNMPELEWYFGYPFALMLMAILAGGMLFFLRWRGWIGSKPYDWPATPEKKGDAAVAVPASERRG